MKTLYIIHILFKIPCYPLDKYKNNAKVNDHTNALEIKN